MDLQNNVNELITLRTNGVEDAMKSWGSDRHFCRGLECKRQGDISGSEWAASYVGRVVSSSFEGTFHRTSGTST